MFPRTAGPELVNTLRRFPAAALVGPRQIGKTTLARQLAPHYFDLEQPQDRLRLDVQWSAICASQQLVALDEAQAAPEVFARLRGAIDADRGRMGRFLLLGSVSPALMTQIADSLAGRLALCELSPLLLEEVSPLTLEDLWLRGGFPDGGIALPDRFGRWQRDYLTLLCGRDLPAWGLPAKPQESQRMLHMLAIGNGQLWNASELGRSLGVSYHTVNHWVEYLEGAFLVRRLMPWFGNLAKRLVKAPRVYLRDSGLLHALLGVPDGDQLLRQPWVGSSFEGFAINQLLDALTARGIEHDAWFFRTADGHEIDLVVRARGHIWAVEIKLSTAPNLRDLDKLDKLAVAVGATRVALVSRAVGTVDDGRRVVTDLPGLVQVVCGG